MEGTPFDDHDDALEKVMDRKPDRCEKHIEGWARKAAAQKTGRDNERTQFGSEPSLAERS